MRRLTSFTTLVLFASIATGNQQTVLEEEVPVGRPTSGDSIWLLSTRHLSSPGYSKSHQTPNVWRYEPHGGWEKATPSDFYDADNPEQITAVYVHGNRIDARKAVQRGMAMYRHLSRGRASDQPVRFVIWSWPSKKIPGPIRDLRRKAARTNTDSYYLSQWIAGIHPEERVSLIGYSLGPRIITGAAHLLGGGVLAGRQLPEDLIEPDRPIRAVAIAAAVESNSLLAGRSYGQAPVVLDRLLLLYNPRDPALKLFHVISKGSRVQALGYTGFRWATDYSDRIRQFNVYPIVGKSHALQQYTQSPSLMRMVRQHALWK